MISLVIISGRSGSGKSTALHVLEDMGYYCIDNLPVGLLPPLLDRLAANQVTQKVSVSIDARNVASELANFQQIIEGIDQDAVALKILYLDSAGATLVKRFSETRRKHPLSGQETSLREALEKEAELLDPIASAAHLTIDTTTLTIHELRDMVKTRVAEAGHDFALLFVSFAFKNGVPVDADLVFDVRCLPNPHWKTNLRNLTGLDEPVREFLEALPEVDEMLDDISSFLKRWLPTFEANNRSYMTIAIGCTGGQHRSVYFAERLHDRFAPMWDNVQIRHRELNRVAIKQENLKFN
jgi:UPF0042 nucleotide-binding protein